MLLSINIFVKKVDLQEDSSIFIKKVFKILPPRQIAAWPRNFETRAMLDCRCRTGNIHMKTSQEQK